MTLELLNVPLQAWVWFGAVGLPVTAVNATGFAAFAVLLVVGAAYWAHKLRQLRRPGLRLPRFFAVARVLLPAALAVVLIVCTVAAVRDPGRASWPGLGFALFAVLEHINYFHTQLMYDTRADLRRLFRSGLQRAHLARDLRSTASSSAGLPL